MAEVSQQYEGCQSNIAAGGVPKGAKTSDYYRTKEIPTRFDNPGMLCNQGNPVFSCPREVTREQTENPNPEEWFEGYVSKDVHPMYRTTNSAYGGKAPTVHTMPTSFHAKSQSFSKNLGKCGMFRNHSLNCAMDKSNVPDK